MLINNRLASFLLCVMPLATALLAYFAGMEEGLKQTQRLRAELVSVEKSEGRLLNENADLEKTNAQLREVDRELKNAGSRLEASDDALEEAARKLAFSDIELKKRFNEEIRHATALSEACEGLVIERNLKGGVPGAPVAPDIPKARVN
jgi:DNA repair ATPase RecN